MLQDVSKCHALIKNLISRGAHVNFMDLEKLPAIMFIVLGITALLYLLVFVFNMMSLITVFIIVAFVLAILAIITGVLMLKEGGE